MRADVVVAGAGAGGSVQQIRLRGRELLCFWWRRQLKSEGLVYTPRSPLSASSEDGILTNLSISVFTESSLPRRMSGRVSLTVMTSYRHTTTRSSRHAMLRCLQKNGRWESSGAEFHIGRPADHAMQSTTLSFTVTGFDPAQLKDPSINTWGGYWSLNEELGALYSTAKKNGITSNPKQGVTCFAYPDGKTLLFNSNEVKGVNPMVPSSVSEARAVAERHVHELFAIIRRHPAFSNSVMSGVSTRLGVREGRRILGDYVLTGDDCMREARFEDMVAACEVVLQPGRT